MVCLGGKGTTVMERALSELQKTILRMALRNREAAGVTVKQVVEEHEVQQISTDGTTSSDRYSAPGLKPSKEGWVDLEQTQVLQECFGINYTPTFEEEFGLLTPASARVASKQYRAAEELVQEAILGFADELVELYFVRPCAWDGLPNRLAITLKERGMELARRLREDCPREAGNALCLDPETESRYRELLKRAGVGEEKMFPAGECPLQNPPARETPVSSFVGLLRSADPSKRHMAIIALRQIGAEAAEAVPALREALEDPVPGIRLVASWALKEIEQNA
jgi:hypothetical protein